MVWQYHQQQWRMAGDCRGNKPHLYGPILLPLGKRAIVLEGREAFFSFVFNGCLVVVQSPHCIVEGRLKSATHAGVLGKAGEEESGIAGMEVGFCGSLLIIS